MSEQNNIKTDELIARIKELVKEGNIARIRVMRKEDTVMNIPLNAGLVGTAIGIAAGPWALITAAVATLGLDCRIILVKKDGSEMELLSRDVGRKAASVGSSILGKFSGDDKE
ncbi:MAG: DUF4342 domain-containing protein [Oscillospiraceae bacterium]|nr:DUF4342 domain-containing protein [Oscillospiraceae bacterium]